jgi:hypothetical protein
MNSNRDDQPFELSSDMTEIALLAFASPEFVERHIAELFGGAPAGSAPAQSDSVKVRIAA